MKRAAHFLLLPELAYSPPNDAIVHALLEQGWEVDLFAPGRDFDVSEFGSRVRALSVEHRKRWIVEHLANPSWCRYRLLSGTTEDPMAAVGLIAATWRIPSFTLADEIRSGPYGGNRSRSWKRLCRWGMRRSRFTFVNDESRVELQRRYAGLSEDHPIIVYPGCFKDLPVPWDRGVTRRERGIPDDALCLCYSGTFNHGNGGLWMLSALEAHRDLHVWGQIVNVDPLTRGLIKRVRGADRLHLEPKRLAWRDSWASMSAADIGIVIYLQEADQFRNMGISSNRLCMFLAMGVPVIANRQPSFEFIERYDCGVLVENEREFVEAIGRVRDRLLPMRQNALRCAQEYIDAPGRYQQLVEQIRRIG